MSAVAFYFPAKSWGNGAGTVPRHCLSSFDASVAQERLRVLGNLFKAENLVSIERELEAKLLYAAYTNI